MEKMLFPVPVAPATSMVLLFGKPPSINGSRPKTPVSVLSLESGIFIVW